MLFRLYTFLSLGCLSLFYLPGVTAQCAINVTPSPTLCAGTNNGSLTVEVSGGVTPYSYVLNGAAVVNSPVAIFTIPNLAAGAYDLIVTDGTGCTANGSAIIAAPPSIGTSTVQANVLCNGTATGSIDLIVSGGTSSYTYNWSNGSTSSDLTGLPAGTYTVTVTDANNCSNTISSIVTEPAPIIVQALITNLNCNTTMGGVVQLFVVGGAGTYQYMWSNGAQTKDIGNLSAGTYCVTVTDVNGCTATTCATITEPPPLTINPVITYTNCSSASVAIDVVGGTPPFTYLWNTGISTPLGIFQSSGNYSFTVTDANGCTATTNINIDLNASGLCGTIAGRVLQDTIENCQTDAEPGLANWIVQAVGANTYYGLTDAAGQYYLGVESGSAYTLSVVPPNVLWEACPSQPVVTVSQPNDTVSASDILVQKTADCPALTVTIATGQLRRCFAGFYSVNYCNEGTTPAENAYIVVTLDPYLSLDFTTIPHTDLGNGQFRFDLGLVDVGFCGGFKIYVNVSCDATLSQVHCTEAHIYPDSSCLPPNPLWSGASLQIQSACETDSLRFVIKNVGTGNLTETVNYIVIEDQVMLMSAPVPLLLAGDAVQIAFPANGSTWRVEVQQAAFHPGVSQPSLSVEGCSTGVFTTGFVSQFPADDADPWLDIDCTANIGSFDPNDKQGFPVGYGSAHYIRPGTEIEYKIRFQNTGTDTAFTVLVVDTLSAWLDPATVKFGPASHPYRAELYGSNILKFHFENILLADSNVNEAASHGFLQFRISPRADAPLETQIENQAQIYFDFNAPVLTNITFHRLGEQFVTSGLWQPHVPGATINVSPNPFDEQARLEVKGAATNAPLHLEVFDLQGNKVREMTSNDAVFSLKKGNWPTGVYLFRISQKGKLVGSGKLMVE